MTTLIYAGEAPAPASRRSGSQPIEPGLTGRRIGAYTLVSPIGQGGMGSVWLAERSDGRFERRTSVKFLSLALAGRAGAERTEEVVSLLRQAVLCLRPELFQHLGNAEIQQLDSAVQCDRSSVSNHFFIRHGALASGLRPPRYQGGVS